MLFHAHRYSALRADASFHLLLPCPSQMCTRTTLTEMTQVGPEPALPAQPNQDDLQVPEIEDLSHISLHQVNKFTLSY